MARGLHVGFEWHYVLFEACPGGRWVSELFLGFSRGLNMTVTSH
jgi:hypothetical protein